MTRYTSSGLRAIRTSVMRAQDLRLPSVKYQQKLVCMSRLLTSTIAMFVSATLRGGHWYRGDIPRFYFKLAHHVSL
jgi:hypothetical protein